MKRIASILLCATSLPLFAATFTVTNTDDSGPGSLRQAILDANGTPGFDTIAFNIPGTGVHTITPATSLPLVSEAALVDGYSQPGATENTDPVATNAVLLIELDGSATTGAVGLIASPSGGSTIQGLVINRWGTALQTGIAGGNVIRGNFVGTDPSGSFALPNSGGVSVGPPGERVGGTAPGDRNLISGNAACCLNSAINPGPNGVIQGNLIGTDATGTRAIPNGIGILLSAADVTVGGTAPGAGNVISGNGIGIFLSQSNTHHVIQGNRIGTTADGNGPLGNGDGIQMNVGGDTTTIGGLAPGEGNVIAYNSNAGVNVTGNGGSKNAIRGNSIHDNAGLGIDLASDGPSFNDPQDADGGVNGKQNFPILQSVEHIGLQGAGGTRIVGKFNSAPTTTFDLDFYSNPACAKFPRELFEGEVYLGTSQATTDANGDAAIDVTLPVATEAGARIAATATDPAGNTSEFSQRILFSISPASGPDTGGTPFTAFGTDFADPTTLTVGGVPATGVTFVNDHQLSAVMPAFAPGTSQDVVATTSDGNDGDADQGLGLGLPRRARGTRLSRLRRHPRLQRHHRGRRRRFLRRRPGHQAPADGRLPAESQVRPLLRPAPLRQRLPRRPLPVHLRRLDRGARGPGHHDRLRRRLLLPQQLRHPAADGGLPPEDQVRLQLRSAGLRRHLRRRRLPGSGRRRLHRAALRRGNHRRLPGLASPLLPRRHQHPRTDGGLHRQDVRPSVKDSMKRFASILLFAISLPLAAATFTVTNTDDSGPGSLRQAIVDANANPGLDTIAFDIPGAGVQTISPASELTQIFDPVVIDGYTQTGASPNTDPNGFNGTLLIELNGAGAGPDSNGLVISAGGSTVRGLVINRYRGLSAGNAIVLTTAGNHVEGNFLGTDASGTVGLGNEDDGVVLSAPDNVIGGTTPGARNVISAHGRGGIFILSSGNVIQGNFIGTQKDGVSPLGNQSGLGSAGIGGANNNTVGGTVAGEANVIAFSQYYGWAGEAAAGSGNVIRGNSIHDNGALGIELLGAVGPSANDPGDTDTGANNLQNFPIVRSVEHLGLQGTGSTRIVGKLGSAPSTTYDLDFYSNPACSNFPREFVEGQTWLGLSAVTTDGSGNATFDVTLPVATEAGARIAATATDPNGNTSEFSQRILFSISPASGPDTGGTPFTASGTDFADPTTLTVGGIPATGVTFVNDHQLSGVMPAFAPGTSQDVVATTSDGTTATLIKGWVSDFLDVPSAHGFHAFVVTLVSNGITAGVGGGLYGVDQGTKRQQMAVFLLKAKYGLCYVPPPCANVFPDVPCPSTFADWIEALAAEGITTGCGGGNFCPNNFVTRRQMAVFLLKAKYGSSYVPPACAGVFDDVACPGAAAVDFIERLSVEGITGGCQASPPLYCPDGTSTRGQMAVFITKTFGLQ